MKHFLRSSRALLFLLLFFSIAAKAQTADFTSDVVSGCNPLVVSFTDKSTGTSGSSIYAWDFGDSKFSSLKSPSTTYTTPGTYTVKLSVKNSSTGTPSTKTATITVYPSPTVSFTNAPLSGCPCLDVNFSNTSTANAPGAISSIWSFGDGYTATSNNAVHTFCTAGKYDIALKVTNSAGCISTKVTPAAIEVFERPKANFSASLTNICKIPDTTVFTATASAGKAPYTYAWDFGDGGTASVTTPVHAYTTAGSYTVRLVVTDANGCKDTNTKVNYINAVPMNSMFTVPSSICAGVSKVLFEGSSVPTPLKTKWIWSDGGSAIGPTAQRDFWKGGTYTITMIDSFGPGCKDTAEHTYVIHPKPKPNFSYWPIYPCPAPVSIHFTNKSSAADSFQWIFGDGTTSKLKDPVHTYTHDSVFTVFMIAKTSFGCLDTFRVRDTSVDFPGGYPNPIYDSSNSPIIVRVFDAVPNIKADTISGCLPLTSHFSFSIYTNTHLPSARDTSRPPLCGPIAGYASPPYWYCFNVPGGGIGDPYPDPFFDPPYPKITSPYYYPYDIRTYSWDFGDGGTSTAATPAHTYTSEGKFTVRCTVTTDSCSFTDTFAIEAGYKPVANFSFSPGTICKGEQVTVTNLSTGGLKYVWDWADSYTDVDTAKMLTHWYKVYGSRRIMLYASRYGCQDTISKLLVINPPGSSFGIRYSCDTILKVAFIDSSYRATRVFWLFGDGDTSTLRSPVHIYSDTGSFSVKMITYNDSFSCTDTLEKIVHLYSKHPQFVANDTTVCLGDTVFLLNDKPNYIIDYAWKTANSVQIDSVTGKYFVLYKDTGTYSVTMYFKDNHGCRDSFTRKAYILVAKPWPKIIATPLYACAPASIDFEDASTDTKGAKSVIRTWYWGDATFKTDTAKKATKFYAGVGSYTVKLVTTDNVGCKDSVSITVESRKPVANFKAELDTFSCIGRPIKFFSDASGVGLTYLWYFGDGNTATSANPIYAYSSAGTFNVKLVVTDASGCKDSITKTAFVKITRPTASFTMSDSVALCPPLFVDFSNTSSNAIRYIWDFANGSKSTAPSPTSPFIDSGVYHVQLVAVDNHGCTDTAWHDARVLGYNGLLHYSPLNGCAPLSVDFIAESFNFDVMVWDFADGYTESAKGKFTTSHTYTEPGYYIPRLILGDGKGCATSSNGIDTIKVDGIHTTISTSPACEGAEITFNDSSFSYFSEYATSLWTFEDGSTSSDKNPKRRYPKAGSYSIKLVTSNTNGCMDSVERQLVIHPLPKVVAKDTVICLNDQAVLSAIGALSYTWLPDPSLSCTDCDRPTTITKVPIQYYVIGTDEFGCQNMDTLTVGIKTKTTLILADDTDVCAHVATQLYASGAQQYIWSPAKYLDNPNIPNPIATLDSSIIYRVIGTEGSCIPDTAFINVTVHPTPEVNAGPDQRVLAGTIVLLNGSGKYIDKYLWSPADSLSCSDCPNPSVKPSATITYTLKGVSKFGCSDSDDVVIVVFCDQSQLFIPNTFTPNGDGQNDYFFPQGKGVSKIKAFIIYNRWGQKVFERTNMDVNTKEQGWDGTLNGNALNPDTFVYTIEADCANGETVFWKGDVTIIK